MPIETFLEKCREVIRLKHLSYRTEETYLPVIRRFIEFHGGRTQPKDMSAAEIRAVLPPLPALLRHPPAGRRLRHSDRAGAAGPPGRLHHHDLHSRPQPRRSWGAKSP